MSEITLRPGEVYIDREELEALRADGIAQARAASLAETRLAELTAERGDLLARLTEKSSMVGATIGQLADARAERDTAFRARFDAAADNARLLAIIECIRQQANGSSTGDEACNEILHTIEDAALDVPAPAPGA